MQTLLIFTVICIACTNGQQVNAFAQLFQGILGQNSNLNQLAGVVNELAAATGTCNPLKVTTTTQAFLKTLQISSDRCQAGKIKPGLRATCSEKTIADVIRRIPEDTYSCIRSQIPTDVVETLRMCMQREQTRDIKKDPVPNPYSWQDLNIVVTSPPVYATKYKLRPQDVTPCHTQMIQEQNDCRVVRDMMCGFVSQQSFDCATAAQLKRQSKTTSTYDDCQIVSLRLVQENDKTTTTTTTTPKPTTTIKATTAKPTTTTTKKPAGRK